jgi:hypothetical protein
MVWCQSHRILAWFRGCEIYGIGMGANKDGGLVRSIGRRRGGRGLRVCGGVERRHGPALEARGEGAVSLAPRRYAS